MRSTLIETLIQMAQEDERIFLLTADLGWSVVEPFLQAHPRRFLNVGVAEANMMGVATGLALTGYVPFVYSIATFASMRAYEPMRNGPLLHRLPVRIAGIGGGYAYGHGGPTHHALEDLALARLQPGMTVLAPADPAQTRSAVLATRNVPGPVYLRIGKGGNAAVPGLDGRFAFGRPELVRAGRDALLLATGSLVHEALGAAQALGDCGISAAVAVQAHLPFSPSPELVALLRRFPAVVTAEEGYATGGLGSLAAEAIAGERLACRLEIRGVREPFGPASGSEAYLRRRSRLDSTALAEAVRCLLA